MQEMARCVILAVWTWTSVLSLMNASAAGSEVWTQGTEKPLLSGQTVCLHGTQRPCYKMAAFPYASRRLPFMAARRACETEGATLVSVDSPAEQRLLESLLSSLRVPPGGDGDFWIGLRRDSREGSTCAQRYSWIDGSKSKYRHWYTDEPSCGAEACVVMYHQPTARPGFGGRYLYRWNDDRCNMRHNYICKYAGEKMSETANSSVLDYTSIPSILPFPDDSIISKESFGSKPLLLLLLPLLPLILIAALVIVLLCTRSGQRRSTKPPTEPSCPAGLWTSPGQGSSLDLHRIISEQNRTGSRNGIGGLAPLSSFRGGSAMVGPAASPGSGGESGFVTLGSAGSEVEGYPGGDQFSGCTHEGWAHHNTHTP
uniref:chondrolectin-like isoform X2 n=1 Tax=Myxine glutinosa TaxID=7769 RepID=UPI00358EDCE5